MEHPTVRGLSGWVPLARGGFTLVWEARQDLLSRPVAVKIYQRGLADEVYGTFLREAGAAGRLSDHPGVVTVYDAGLLPDSRPYLIMELCPGGSLTPWLNAENLHTEEQVRWVGMRVADALAGLHARGVLHRDVKPANILIDGFGRPRLADFGLAAVAGDEAVAADALRMTPAYAPPEAFTAAAATESGDVFSLAATLYALLAGCPPPRLGTAGDLPQLAEVACQPITPLPGVNWYLMDAVMAALSTDPADRPSAAEFCDRLSTVPAPRTRMGKPPLVVVDRQPLALPSKRRVLAGHHATTNSTVVAGSGSRFAPARGGHQPVADAPPRRGRRRAGMFTIAATMVALAAFGTAWLVAEPASSDAPAATLQIAGSGQRESSADPSRGAAAAPSSQVSTTSVRPAVSSDPIAGALHVTRPADTAEPFETIRIRGTYRGRGGTFLEVQLWTDGTWRAFPVPAKTDQSGQFTAFVELGRPDRYRLRVRDPQSGVTSEPFVLVIKE